MSSKKEELEENKKRVPEKVSPLNIKKEKGYLYYVDKDGDVARVPAKWNDDPKFLEKEEEEEKEEPTSTFKIPPSPKLDEPVGVPKISPVPKTLEPVPSAPQQMPVTMPEIPSEFMDKLIFYYDKAVIEIAGDQAVSQAHLKIYPLQSNLIEQVSEDEFIHNSTIASFSASILFETLKAQGTNIIFNELNGTLQTSVIPRFEGDNLNLFWEIKPGDQATIKAIAEQIKDNMIVGEIKDTTKINLDDNNFSEPKKKVNIIDTDKNYMIDHLRRDF